MSIRRYLVRREPLGDVGRYGSVHDLGLRRGDRVVILTPRGTWLGELLAIEPSESSSGGESAPPTGEVLRRATSDDERAAAASARRAREVLQQLPPLLGTLDGAPLDVAVSACQAYAFVSWAGPTSPELGRASVRIAEQFGFSAVQFQPIAAEAGGPQQPRPPIGSSPPSGSCPPSPAPDASRDQQSNAGRLAGAFCSAVPQRVKQHDRDPLGMLGMYRQRPVRRADGARPLAPDLFMLRVRLCGGRTTGAQLAALGCIADTYAGGTLRLTSRQGVQIHNCPQQNVAAAMREIDRAMLQCYGTCGNSLRNVMCCPRTPHNRRSEVAWQLATRISSAVANGSWIELFRPESVSGALSPAAEQCIESELPHKWKVSVATDDDNCVDCLVADVGLIVRSSGAEAADPVDVYVGGSLAYKPGNAHSQSALGAYLGTVDARDCLPLLDALQQLFIRTPPESAGAPRHMRRWKYVVRQLGIAAIRRSIDQRMPGRLRVEIPARVPGADAHLGWHEEKSGTAAVGFFVPEGRLDFRQPDCVDWRQLFSLHTGPVRVMPDYGLMLCGISRPQRPAIAHLLQNATQQSDTSIRVCPALPSCPLAIYDIRALAAQLQDLATPGVRIAFSGCPNGCSRSLTADIGVIAEKPSELAVFSGGNAVRTGDRRGVFGDAAGVRSAIEELLRTLPRGAAGDR